MEFLKQLYHHILESEAWRSFFSHLRWIDWLAAAALVFGFLGGLKKGFTRAFLGTVTWVLTLALTLEFYPDAVAFLRPHLASFSETWIIFSGFLAVALACLLLFRVLFWGLLFILPAADTSFIELLLAAVFNIFNQALLLSLLAGAILIGPWGQLKTVFGRGDSYTGYPLVQISGKIHAGLQGPLTMLRGKLHLEKQQSKN